MKEEKQDQKMEEEMMQQLRSKATELLLREEWIESIKLYSHYLSLCQEQLLIFHEMSGTEQVSKLHKSLCLAFSNRAEARTRLGYLSDALEDCDRALEIEPTHSKTLLCKGKILLVLNRYSMASDCFKRVASVELQIGGNCETVHEYLDRCKKLEFQSRTGVLDLSEWVLSGFRGKPPELAEYIGAIQIKKSEHSGRGLFATKDIEAGTLLLVTKAVATGRGILPKPGEDSSDSARLVMWKDLVDKVLDAASKCSKTHHLIRNLSRGEDEDGLEIPVISFFKPDGTDESLFSKEKPNVGSIVNILDVNSLTEDAISAKVLGKNSDYYGVGLWILASFINHSCNPNARRLHIGDHVVIHASRDVKAGEEITSAYFDVLVPLNKRREMSKTWGFHCRCRRCKFEEEINCRGEIREFEAAAERGLDMGAVVVGLEENMRRWMVKGKEKGYLRASFWAAFSGAFRSDKSMRRWGIRIPAMEAVVESVAEAVGADERILRVVVEGLKRNGGGGIVQMERALKLGRGVYGRVLKKQAMKAFLELSRIHD